jgi:hypothetical protein
MDSGKAYTKIMLCFVQRKTRAFSLINLKRADSEHKWFPSQIHQFGTSGSSDARRKVSESYGHQEM